MYLPVLLRMHSLLPRATPTLRPFWTTLTYGKALRQHLQAAVGGAVVADHDFVGQRQLGRLDGLQALPQVVAVVPVDQGDGQIHHRFAVLVTVSSQRLTNERPI